MKNSKTHKNFLKIISIFLLLLGVLLVIYMIIEENELGALPLGLVLVGIGGLIFNHFKTK